MANNRGRNNNNSDHNNGGDIYYPFGPNNNTGNPDFHGNHPTSPPAGNYNNNQHHSHVQYPDQQNNYANVPTYDPYYAYSHPAYHPANPTLPFVTPQDNVRKRQRRQAAGNLVTGLFGGGNGVAGKNNNNDNQTTGQKSKSKKKPSTAQPRPNITVLPRGIGPVHDPNENDVLSGRGGRINAHSGNVQFREIVAERKAEYLAESTKKLEKAHIAADIVYHIRRMNPPGRFLKEDNDGAWWDIGDAKAIKKVGQALREDAPDIRGTNSEDAQDDKKDSPDKESEKKEATKKKKSPSSTKKAKSPERSKEIKPDESVSSSGDDRKPPPSTESTPKQMNKDVVAPLPVSSSMSVASMPAPPAKISKHATAISGRGGKKVTTTSRNSPPKYQEMEIRPPSHHQQHAMMPPPPPHYQVTNHQQQQHHQQPQNGTFAYNNNAFRGARPSGAAAAALPINELEFQQDVAFGRQFHPPLENGGESSLISGLSGPSQISGFSGISGLTDPMSSVSNSDMTRTARQTLILDQTRQNWQTSSNSGNVQPENAAYGNLNGNPSSYQIPGSSTFAPRPTQNQNEDNMSWIGNNSLVGGRGGARDDSVLAGGNGSVLSGAGSIFSISGLSATLREEQANNQYQQQQLQHGNQYQQPHAQQGNQYQQPHAQQGNQYQQSQVQHGNQYHQPQVQHGNQYQQQQVQQDDQLEPLPTSVINQTNHSRLQNHHNHQRQPYHGPAAVYYSGDASVTAMSIASHGSLSIQGSVLSELSATLEGLDLAGVSGSGKSMLDI